MTRKSSWTNADGLVVGFGPNTPELGGNGTENDKAGAKVAAVTFGYKDINAGSAINVPVPAGTKMLDVMIKVHDAWVGASNALIVGDGSATNGFITTTAGAVANLTAGANIKADGAYAFGASDTGAAELKLYASADTIDVDSADSDWTAGSASLIVTYL